MLQLVHHIWSHPCILYICVWHFGQDLVSRRIASTDATSSGLHVCSVSSCDDFGLWHLAQAYRSHTPHFQRLLIYPRQLSYMHGFTTVAFSGSGSTLLPYLARRYSSSSAFRRLLHSALTLSTSCKIRFKLFSLSNSTCVTGNNARSVSNRTCSQCSLYS